jgi:hypothetical protein
MQKKVFHHYNIGFNKKSANIILPYLKTIYDFKSVVDVGCGLGTWLSVCESMGVEDILGIDGPHVLKLNRFLLQEKFFFEYNLDNQLDQLKLNKKYDLSICTEVAEHLQPNNAKALVEFLVTSSDVILFAAAVPGQTGENHYNEQFPDYWSDLFVHNNYIFLDPFRELFWNNKEVEWWYRQNLFLVVNKNILYQFRDIKQWDGHTYIIPELLEMYIHHFKTLNADLDIPPIKRSIYKRIKSKVKNIFK